MTNLSDEIVNSFHEQFAQNQNHHQKLFLQVLTMLLTVLVGFGYLYIRVGDNGVSKDINVTPETIYSFLSLSMFLLSSAIATVSNMSLGFRRDQLVACNIRVKSGVMKLNDHDTEEYFPSRFNPTKNISFFTWMPEFHQIFFVLLIIVKFLLILSLLGNSSINVPKAIGPGHLIRLSTYFSVFSFFLDGLIYRRYWKKWKKYASNAPKRLKEAPHQIN